MKDQILILKNLDLNIYNIELKNQYGRCFCRMTIYMCFNDNL